MSWGPIGSGFQFDTQASGDGRAFALKRQHLHGAQQLRQCGVPADASVAGAAKSVAQLIFHDGRHAQLGRA